MKSTVKSPKKFSWMNPKLEVRRTEKYGKGVFAKENIKKGDMLAVHGGFIITVEKESNLPDKFKDHGVQISEDFVISCKTYDEDDGYFNHSCNPNAGYKGQIFLVAMKKIIKDEEVTFDYGMVLHKTRNVKPYRMRCLCGSENCRRYITCYDWQIPEVQKKYDGYFQWYLQEKIDKMKKKRFKK